MDMRCDKAFFLFSPSRGPPTCAAQGEFLLLLRAFENVACPTFAIPLLASDCIWWSGFALEGALVIPFRSANVDEIIAVHVSLRCLEFADWRSSIDISGLRKVCEGDPYLLKVATIPPPSSPTDAVRSTFFLVFAEYAKAIPTC